MRTDEEIARAQGARLHEACRARGLGLEDLAARSGVAPTVDRRTVLKTGVAGASLFVLPAVPLLGAGEPDDRGPRLHSRGCDQSEPFRANYITRWLARRLGELRDARGWTTAQLADALWWEQAEMKDIVACRLEPSYKILGATMNAFGVSSMYLEGFVDDPEDEDDRAWRAEMNEFEGHCDTDLERLQGRLVRARVRTVLSRAELAAASGVALEALEAAEREGDFDGLYGTDVVDIARAVKQDSETSSEAALYLLGLDGAI
jgi:transcriptional regulator with XRE-family HTH domain